MAANKNNATCSICGKPYYKCMSCKDKMAVAPWKTDCDTSEHFKIFQIIRGYNTGVYTKREAAKKLKSVDLSDLDELRDNIRAIIKDIVGDKASAEKKTAENVVDCVMEQEPVIEFVPEEPVAPMVAEEIVYGDYAVETE